MRDGHQLATACVGTVTRVVFFGVDLYLLQVFRKLAQRTVLPLVHGEQHGPEVHRVAHHLVVVGDLLQVDGRGEGDVTAIRHEHAKDLAEEPTQFPQAVRLLVSLLLFIVLRRPYRLRRRRHLEDLPRLLLPLPQRLHRAAQFVQHRVEEVLSCLHRRLLDKITFGGRLPGTGGRGGSLKAFDGVSSVECGRQGGFEKGADAWVDVLDGRRLHSAEEEDGQRRAHRVVQHHPQRRPKRARGALPEEVNARHVHHRGAVAARLGEAPNTDLLHGCCVARCFGEEAGEVNGEDRQLLHRVQHSLCELDRRLHAPVGETRRSTVFSRATVCAKEQAGPVDGGTGGHGRRRRSQGRLRLTMCPPQGDFDRACRCGAAAAAAAGGRVARKCAALAAFSPPPLPPLLLLLSLEAIAAVESGLEAEPLLVDAGHRDGDTLVQPGPRNALLVDRHGAIVAAIQRSFVPFLEG